MNGVVNYLRGTVRVTVVGMFPERVVNLCAQQSVEFWGVDWHDERAVSFTIRRRGFSRLEALAHRVDCEVLVGERRGFPEFARSFRSRYAFLIGLGLTLIAVSVLSQFVLTIEITGNENISDAVILRQLQRFGVSPGAFGPGLDRRQIEQEILLEVPELSWMTINLKGTRVEVQVREVQKAPKRIDESGFYHVVASADGIITHVEPELGDAVVKKGDTVSRGEVLISGTVTMEPPIYSDLPTRYYDVHARGRVWARTWRTITAVIPEETAAKIYTGAKKTCWAINFFGRRVEFFGNSSISDALCDRITSVRQPVLPGGAGAPIWLSREELFPYETTILCVDRDAAENLLEEELAERLKELVGADGQILGMEFQTRVSDGLIRVTVTAECLEEIGQEVPAH